MRADKAHQLKVAQKLRTELGVRGEIELLFPKYSLALGPGNGQTVEEPTLALQNWRLNKPSFCHKMCNTWLGAILYSENCFEMALGKYKFSLSS